MKVYFSGISGTGIGPLAELAQDAGYEVCGSDLQAGAVAKELEERKIPVSYNQDGSFLKQCQDEAPIDWFVYTSALPKDHPELVLARDLGIKASKRDAFLADLVEQKNLKMIAVAGTHGKTTTVSMLIWAFSQLGIPVSYLVGTTLPWANSGHFDNDSEFFIYEADEYDRNFLAYHPYVAAITTVDYDHPDIYPTRKDYLAAFDQFRSQSANVVENTTVDSRINLIGELRRKDASIAMETILKALPNVFEEDLIAVLNRFPGTGRRFERIADGVYTDYGHHPQEIKATLEMAKELCERDNLAGVAAVYQPHQNVRQHEIKHEYKDAFLAADKVFWLPTYLVRENPDLAVLTPEDLISELQNPEVAEAAEANDELAEKLKQLHRDNWLIILLTAGPADTWLRRVFTE